MITQLSAVDLARKLAARELSAVEVAQAYLDRIESQDETYKAYLACQPELVLGEAKAAQEKLDSGQAGPLTGVPIALKDNMSTAGLETTCASKILKGYIPPYNAHVVERLRDEGLILLGKTNLDEFAMGTSTENSAFQITRNPWDIERSPGGSSGGSAAAVCAELAPLALGSDTGGSIRQPAALTGLVGFKPTYGRVSRFGLVAFGSSLDQIGPFARSVEDAAHLCEAISGHDHRDSTSLKHPPISAASIKNNSLKGKRFAIPQELMGNAISPGVADAMHAAMEILKREGAELKEVSLPSIKYGVTTYYIIAPAEASSNLARFDGVRYGPRSEGAGHIGVVERTRAEGFGREVKARIMIGTYALSAGYYDAYYLKAQQVRTLMRKEFDAVLQGVDAILSPTSPVTAFKIGELSQDPMALKLLDYCTIPANMGGNPAISLNCGYSDGLPVGLQLLGAPLQDEAILALASGIESALPDARRRPPIA